MTILEHEINHFRNITHIRFCPESGINMLYGSNGQGKTNILESLWLYTGCHSFRTKKTAELIQQGARFAQTSLRFFAAEREQDAQMKLHQKREVLLNGVAKASPRQLLGEVQAVVFSPEVLSIVKEGPAQRRRFLDVAISVVRPQYAHILAKYGKALDQRNNLLRQIAQGKTKEEYLEPWDEELSLLGARIIEYRRNYITPLTLACESVYAKITQGKEALSLSYLCSAAQEVTDRAELAAVLFGLMWENRALDIRRLYTTAGIHKEDLELLIDGSPARAFGSQGQQRSCALALKIAEAQMLFALSGEKPVVLLDDVMSELDENRQRDLLLCLEDWQVFVTCCEPSQVLRQKTAKAFVVNQGNLV